MSPCLVKYASATAIGGSALIATIPDTPQTIYEQYGLTGLLVAVVVALWVDGKREQAKAEERRQRREDKDDAKHSTHLAALAKLNETIASSSAKCDATRELVRKHMGGPE
jgi:hypothetical protein